MRKLITIRYNHSSIIVPLLSGIMCTLLSPVYAQDTTSNGTSSEADRNRVMEEVVVTAQRRAESMQRVPIAMSSLGQKKLSARGASDLSDLTGSVPNFTVTGFAGVNANNLVSIRGVSGQLAPIGASQATAVYLDGVFLPLPDAVFFGLNDVERIEILRGPQGTLYGRNATAGAVNIVTAKPENTFTGNLDVSGGNFNEVLTRATISGPIGPGLSARITGYHHDRDGFFENTTTGNDIGDKRKTATRVRLRYENGSNFEAILSGDYLEIRGPDIFKNGLENGELVGLGNPDKLTNNEEGRLFGRTNNGGVSLEVNYDITESLVITSISSWRSTSREDGYDIDGSDRLPLYVDSAHDSESIMQEIRALYSGTRLTVTGGLNYFQEDATFGFIVNPPDPTNPRANLSPFDTSDLEAFAAFAQVEFDITEAITVIGGIRYNDETRDFTVDYTNAPIPGNFVAGTVSDSTVLPMATINFQVRPNVLAYAKFSQGYQAPGFGFVPGPTAPANTFDAEFLDAYELGLKSQFLDDRVTLNAAGFYYDYDDLQVRTQIREGEVGITNAASATVTGIEVELVVHLTNQLTLSAHGAWLDATYDSFCESVTAGSLQLDDPPCVPLGASMPTGADRSGNYLNNSPESSGGASIEYSTRVSDRMMLSFSSTYTLQDTSFLQASNGIGQSGGWDRLDARLNLEFDNGLNVYAYGRNLTDDRYCGFCLHQNALILSQAISDPRTYGIGASFQF